MNAAVTFATSMAVVLAVGMGIGGSTNTGWLGTFGPTMAAAAEWAEGALLEIKGLERAQEKEGRSGQSSVAFDKVVLVMEGGKTLRLDPKVRVRREAAGVMSLEELPAQSRIRYSPQTGLVTEIILLDMLAR